MATAWQPIQATAVAVPRASGARGHSRAPLARLTTITGPGYAQSLFYNAAGRLTVDERIGSEPWQKLYGYDNNGNRTTSVMQTGGESVLLRFSGALPPEVVAQSGQWDVDQQQLRVQMGSGLGPLTGKGLAQIATSGRPTRLSAQVQVVW